MRHQVELLVSAMSEEGSIENFKASFTIRGEISVDTLMDRAQKEASNSCRKRGGNWGLYEFKIVAIIKEDY